MESVKYILSKSDYIENIGEIYPVKVKDYDEFAKHSKVLMINKNHFEVTEDDYKLLDLLISYGLHEKQIINSLEQLFSLILKKKVVFIFTENSYGFVIGDKKVINRDNYDKLREIIMKQNLLFEPKVFKDKLVQEWAEKVLKARQRNGIEYDIEDMITTVKNFNGITYEKVAEQTLYQLYADFKRILKTKGYDTSVSFKCAGADKVNIEHFAEKINMFENPYDGLFVSKEKVGQLDKALNNK